MRLGVSLLNFRPGRIGGTETYLRQLVAQLPAAAGGDTVVALLHAGCARDLPTPGLERCVLPRGDAAVVAARCAEAFTPWRDRALERLVAEARLDAVLFPQQSIYPMHAAAPAVLTVHDLLHLEEPGALGAFDRALRARIYGASLERAARVIAISESTARALTARCGVSPGRITVVPHGLDPPPGAVAPWRGRPEPYLYYPSATYVHKGHDRLLRAFAALPASCPAKLLVLTGERTVVWRRLLALARLLGVADRVLHLGFVPRETVHALYAGAFAVVFPSRHEGFGIPVLEAVSHGRPVVTSRLPVFEELGMPDAARIDFDDPGQLAAALERPLPTRLTRPTCRWTDTAARTLEVLRAAAAAGAV